MKWIDFICHYVNDIEYWSLFNQSFCVFLFSWTQSEGPICVKLFVFFMQWIFFEITFQVPQKSIWSSNQKYFTLLFCLKACLVKKIYLWINVYPGGRILLNPHNYTVSLGVKIWSRWLLSLSVLHIKGTRYDKETEVCQWPEK